MNNKMIEKRITQKTYHHLISCYGKEKIDQYFNTKIEKEFQEGISLKEIWKKYGYYLAKSKKNLFFDVVFQEMKSFVNRKEKSTSFSLEEEIDYGFSLLKKDYIQLFAKPNQYLELDLGKIFSSIESVQGGKEIVEKFQKFYAQYNRNSNFDQYFQGILKKANALLQEEKIPSCKNLGLSSSSSKVLFQEELLEQIDMYLDYSKAVYLFQIHNIPLVKYFVKLYFTDWHIEELEQSGMIGLTEAILKFDIRKCIPFSSYAYFYIKRSILNSAYVDYHLFGVPLGIASLQNKAMKITDDYYFHYGKKISDSELALKLNFKDIKLLSFFRDRNHFFCESLQNPWHLDKNYSYEYINDVEELERMIDNIFYDEEKFYNVEDILNEYDFSLFLKDIETILSAKEKDILLKRIGYQLEEPMKLQQIGKEYQLTGEGVRRIYYRSLEKLKKSKKIKTFKTY